MSLDHLSLYPLYRVFTSLEKPKDLTALFATNTRIQTIAMQVLMLFKTDENLAKLTLSTAKAAFIYPSTYLSQIFKKANTYSLTAQVFEDVSKALLQTFLLHSKTVNLDEIGFRKILYKLELAISQHALILPHHLVDALHELLNRHSNLSSSLKIEAIRLAARFPDIQADLHAKRLLVTDQLSCYEPNYLDALPSELTHYIVSQHLDASSYRALCLTNNAMFKRCQMLFNQIFTQFDELSCHRDQPLASFNFNKLPNALIVLQPFLVNLVLKSSYTSFEMIDLIESWLSAIPLNFLDRSGLQLLTFIWGIKINCIENLLKDSSVRTSWINCALVETTKRGLPALFNVLLKKDLRINPFAFHHSAFKAIFDGQNSAVQLTLCQYNGGSITCHVEEKYPQWFKSYLEEFLKQTNYFYTRQLNAFFNTQQLFNQVEWEKISEYTKKASVTLSSEQAQVFFKHCDNALETDPSLYGQYWIGFVLDKIQSHGNVPSLWVRQALLLLLNDERFGTYHNNSREILEEFVHYLYIHDQVSYQAPTLIESCLQGASWTKPDKKISLFTSIPAIFNYLQHEKTDSSSPVFAFLISLLKEALLSDLQLDEQFAKKFQNISTLDNQTISPKKSLKEQFFTVFKNMLCLHISFPPSAKLVLQAKTITIALLHTLLHDSRFKINSDHYYVLRLACQRVEVLRELLNFVKDDPQVPYEHLFKTALQLLQEETVIELYSLTPNNDALLKEHYINAQNIAEEQAVYHFFQELAIEAAKQGRADIIAALVKTEASLQFLSIFYHAIAYAQFEVAKKLLEQGHVQTKTISKGCLYWIVFYKTKAFFNDVLPEECYISLNLKHEMFRDLVFLKRNFKIFATALENPALKWAIEQGDLETANALLNLFKENHFPTEQYVLNLHACYQLADNKGHEALANTIDVMLNELS